MLSTKTLLVMVGLLGGLLIGVSVAGPPMRRLRRDLQRSPCPYWVSVTAASLVFTILALLIATSAVSEEPNGESPIVLLPFLGRFLSLLGMGERSAYLLIALSVLAIAWSMTVAGPVRQWRGSDTVPRSMRNVRLVWCLLIAFQIARTAVSAPPAPDLVPYIATTLAVGACIACGRLLPSDALLRVLTFVATSLVLSSYLVLVLSKSWSFTDAWPGGFVGVQRLEGFFPQPNVAGEAFGFCFILVATRRDVTRAYRAGFLLAVAVLLCLTGSRGAVAMCGVALVATWAYNQGLRRLVASALTALIVLGAAVPFLELGAGARAFNGRGDTWSLALSLIRSGFLLGHGAFPIDAASGQPAAFYAHNQWLQITAECGIVGMALLALAVASHILRIRRGRAVPIHVGAIASMCVLFAVENPVRAYAPAFCLYFALALLVALAEPTVRETDTPEGLGATRIVPEPIRVG